MYSKTLPTFAGAEIDRQRRRVLQGLLAGAVTGAAVCAGILIPRQALAAWPKDAFAAHQIEEALQALFGDHALSDGTIEIDAPTLAQNGAVVRVTVTTDLPEAESITLFASANNNPLVARFHLTPKVPPKISTRIKMAKSGDVVAVVRAGGKLYSARKPVKVTIGGCGG